MKREEVIMHSHIRVGSLTHERAKELPRGRVYEEQREEAAGERSVSNVKSQRRTTTLSSALEK